MVTRILANMMATLLLKARKTGRNWVKTLKPFIIILRRFTWKVILLRICRRTKNWQFTSLANKLNDIPTTQPHHHNTKYTYPFPTPSITTSVRNSPIVRNDDEGGGTFATYYTCSIDFEKVDSIPIDANLGITTAVTGENPNGAKKAPTN